MKGPSPLFFVGLALIALAMASSSCQRTTSRMDKYDHEQRMEHQGWRIQ
jgi:hypothetical protein